MIGGGQMIPQFEQTLIGLKKGDKKTFTIAAADAYGARDEEALQEVPLTAFGDLELKQGMQLATSNPVTGEQMIVTVAELKKDVAVIDFNHFARRQGPDVRDRGCRRAQADEGRAVGAAVDERGPDDRGTGGRVARPFSVLSCDGRHRGGRPR